MALVAEAAMGSGLALGTASIFSVGPNNLMMIREGLRRGRVWMVGLMVWGSYLLLICLACILTEPITAGLAPLRFALSLLGIAAIAWFAFTSLRAACRARPAGAAAEDGYETRAACLRRVLAVIWLNPLTYVELLLIPAALSATFETTGKRLQFMIGLLIMSTACVSGYSLGGGFCAALLRHRRSLQAFDILSGLTLAMVAATMAAGLATGRWP